MKSKNTGPNTTRSNELAKVKIAFGLNYILTTIAFLVFFQAMESGVTWKIVAALIGTLGFGTFLVLLFKRLIALREKSVT